MSNGASIRYVAELSHVCEISLLGTADLDYWRGALEGEDVTLAERDGRAQVLVISAASKYFGLRFEEVSFSLLVEAYQGKRIAGAYLLQAFNSRRFFAFCERTLFRTPYEHADVSISCWPGLIEVRKAGCTLFSAENSADDTLQSREPLYVGPDGWEGPVLLPRKIRGNDEDGKLFFAKVGGLTRVYPFLPSDNLKLNLAQGCDIAKQLVDSHFVGREWFVREDAEHAKSKTYSRKQAMTHLLGDEPAIPISNRRDP